MHGVTEDFEPPVDFNLAEQLKYSIGIILPNVEQPAK
jgi:hypothetical protein